MYSKRLKDNARAWRTHGALKDMSHFISNLRQGAKHIHVAERCVPTQKRRNALSTLAPPYFFFETPELDAELVHIVAMYCTHVLRWVGNRWLRS